MVIEEAPDTFEADGPISAPSRPQHVLPLSAKSLLAMSEIAARLQAHLAANPTLDIEDVCRTMATGRARLPVRAAVKADFLPQMTERLEALSRKQTAVGVTTSAESASSRPRVAFLFSGQGAQYNGMGRKLYSQEPAFRAALDRVDCCLAPHLGSSIIEVMHAGPEDARLHQTAFTQPALFALEYALAELWRGWGVEPDLVMGHSVGEFAAACISGVLKLEDAAELIAARGCLMQALPEGGGMAALFAPLETVEPLLAGFGGKVCVAAANAPRNTVVSGEKAAVDALVDRMAANGVQGAPLNVSHAFHSHLMDPMLDELRRIAANMTHRQPGLRYISNLTGQAAGRDTLGPDYWADHARHPVLFERGLRAAAEAGCTIFLEIGPHATLIAMGQQVLADADRLWLASLRRGAPDWDTLTDTLADLYVRGAPVNWARFFGPATGAPVILPTYPFERQRFWIERREMTRRVDPLTTSASCVAAHPLLGQRILSAGKEILFQAALGVDASAWLRDHAVDGQAIFPATGYVEIALAAATTALGKACAIADLAFEAPLVFAEGSSATVQTILRHEAGGTTFEISSLPIGAADWRRHAAGRLNFSAIAVPAPADLKALRASCPEAQDVTANYARMRAHGMEYGPAFQGIRELWSGDQASFARICMPAALSGGLDGAYRLHPALTDACLQTLGATFTTVEAENTLYLPVALDRLEHLCDRLPQEFWCHAVLRQPAGDTVIGDVQLLDNDGKLLSRIQGVRLRRTSLKALKRAIGGPARSVYHQLDWIEAPLASHVGTAPEGAIVVTLDGQGVGERVTEALRAEGATVRQVTLAKGSTPDELAALVVSPVDGKKVARVLALQSVNMMPGAASDYETVAAGMEMLKGLTLDLIKGIAGVGDAGPELALVTCGAQAVGAGPCRTVPEAALIWGLGRVAQSELPALKPVLYDLDPADIPGSTRGLVENLLHPDGENQIAWRHGVRFAARVAGLPEPEATERPLVQLQIPERGELSNLRLTPVATEEPGPGQVKILVHATGLNFRDVLNALDMYPGDPGPLGGECAGVVMALGEGVRNLKLGDKVTGIAPGSFRTEALADARQVAVIPAEMSFADAATLPITFLTAHYALNCLGRLKKGERVLIHAAAGGVGQAAVQLARNAGAEIFATAGNPEKRAMLQRQGVHHVMDLLDRLCRRNHEDH